MTFTKNIFLQITRHLYFYSRMTFYYLNSTDNIRDISTFPGNLKKPFEADQKPLKKGNLVVPLFGILAFFPSALQPGLSQVRLVMYRVHHVQGRACNQVH